MFKILIFIVLLPLVQQQSEFEPRIGLCFDRHYTQENIDDYEYTFDVWTYDYGIHETPSQKTEQFQQVWSTKLTSSKITLITRVALTNQGATWLLGNEPDGIGQSARTPEQYAEEYHTLYHLIKGKDPTSKVYFGGITQPSPLRLLWLSKVLEHYELIYSEKLPMDGLHFHNYIMPEVGGSGIGLPVGVTESKGAYNSEYFHLHSDLATFKTQVIRMRVWMKQNDYQNKPLILSEYGILLPIEWGYDTKAISSFMTSTMEWLLNSTDSKGLERDKFLLVQRFAWFSVNSPLHPNAMLYTNKELNQLGLDFERFINGRQ